MSAEDRVVLVSLLSGLGAAISAVLWIPQMLRLLRTHRVAGISPSTCAFTVVSGLCWAAVGACAGLPFLVLSSSLAVAAQIPMLLVLRRAGVWPGRNQAIAAGLLTVYAVVGLCAGWAALTIVLAMHAVVQYWPQVRLALRGRDLGGVSPASAALLITTGCVWGLVGLCSGDAALVVWAAVVMTAGAVVLQRRLALNPAEFHPR